MLENACQGKLLSHLEMPVLAYQAYSSDCHNPGTGFFFFRYFVLSGGKVQVLCYSFRTSGQMLKVSNCTQTTHLTDHNMIPDMLMPAVH